MQTDKTQKIIIQICMNSLTGEQIIILANLFVIEISKGSNKKELITAKNFFQAVVSNLNIIIQDK